MKVKPSVPVLLSLIFSLLMLSACENSFEGSDVKTSDFTVNSESSYLMETLDFVAQDSLGGSFYSWDFGDGTTLKSTHRVAHQYIKSGEYTVNLSVGRLKSTKEIVVNPGTISFKFINNSSKRLDFLTYIDNYEDGSVKRFQVDNQSQSDTIYGSGLRVNWHALGVSIFIKNTEYCIPNLPGIYDFQHQNVIFTDTTKLFSRSSGGNFSAGLIKDL